MKRVKKVKKAGSRKLSTKQLKDLPLKDYTALLVDEMVKTLNARVKKRHG
jgi:hypothetical protein